MSELIPPDMPALEFHPFANMFPPLAAEQREALAADLAANGQQRPILVHEAMILDGRARYELLRERGQPALYEVAPRLELDALLLVFNANAPRLSDEQRSIMLGRLETMLTSPLGLLVLQHLQKQHGVPA